MIIELLYHYPRTTISLPTPQTALIRQIRGAFPYMGLGVHTSFTLPTSSSIPATTPARARGLTHHPAFTKAMASLTPTHPSHSTKGDH